MEGQALMQRLPEALQQFRVRDTSHRLIVVCGGLGLYRQSALAC